MWRINLMRRRFLKRGRNFKSNYANELMIKVLKKVIGPAIFFIIIMASRVFAAPADDYPELQKLKSFIDFIISIIRWGGASVGALIATVTGWQMVTKLGGNALETAKKNLMSLFWGELVIFFGSSGVQFLVNKFWQIFLQ